MNRRRVLEVTAGLIGASAGCIESGANGTEAGANGSGTGTGERDTATETGTRDTTTEQRTTTETPTAEPGAMALKRIEQTYPSELPEPTVSSDAAPSVAVRVDHERGVVGVLGVDRLPNVCHSLRADTAYEEREIRVELTSVDTSADDVACTTSIQPAYYEFGFYFSKYDPDRLTAVVVNGVAGTDMREPVDRKT